MLFKKQSTIINPAPANAWVFIDEHPDSINDGFFFVKMGQTADWYDLPASYHNGSGGLSFADGHADIKRWKDKSISGRAVTKVNLSAHQTTPANPNNDLIWLQERTTSKVQ
jgi:prepilin-type processing-associated H-X9-DG protein